MANLSKSRFVSGTQCEKKLFFDVFRKDLKPPVSEQQQALFDTGHELGRLAQQVFPGGLDASKDAEGKLSVWIERTRRWIEQGETTIYEASFSITGGYAALDILHHQDGERWAIEVKSSGSVKDYHLTDAAYQYFVMNRAGFRPDKVFLMHLNTRYVKKGPIDPTELLRLEDITAMVLERQSAIEQKSTSLLAMLELGSEPIREIGKHCKDPFTCDYLGHCRGKLPDQHVFELYNARGKDLLLFQQGIDALSDIPEDFRLTNRQQIQVSAVRAQLPHIDEKAINGFLMELEAPLYFFDFETINATIPLLDGTSPFQQVPFQYSLHVTDLHGNILEHKAFLAEPEDFTDPGAIDPRRSLLDHLKKDIGTTGTIVAYNATFETTVLKRLAVDFPEEQEFLNTLKPRFKDLLVPFRKGWYYLPVMGKSASIKDVLPAIAPAFSYDGLPINNGGDASKTYQTLILGGLKKERTAIRTALLDYCQRDTEGMVVIYRKLKELTIVGPTQQEQNP